MKDLKELLRRLDEEGSVGLDRSPGEAICSEAAKVIRQLQTEVAYRDGQIEELHRVLRVVGEATRKKSPLELEWEEARKKGTHRCGMHSFDTATLSNTGTSRCIRPEGHGGDHRFD